MDKDLDLITDEGAKKLKPYFKGRVSYLRGITSDIKRVFKGTSITIPGIEQKKEYFKVSKSRMSGISDQGICGSLASGYR